MKPLVETKDRAIRCGACAHVVSRFFETPGLAYLVFVALLVLGRIFQEMFAVESLIGFLALCATMLALAAAALCALLPLADMGKD